MISNKQISEQPFKDPLRELILMSENPSAKVDETYVTTLAKEASVLSHVKEIRLEAKSSIPKPTTIVTQPTDTLAVTEVKSLSTMFQDKCEIIDPVKNKSF